MFIRVEACGFPWHGVVLVLQLITSKLVIVL